MEAHYEENLANRVASFSYYLKPGDQENFVQKLNGLHHIKDDDPLPTIFSHQQSPRKKSPIIKPSQNVKISQPIETQENILFRVIKSQQVHDIDEAEYSSATNHHLQRTSSSSHNGEIGVFGADKYFNTPLECDTAMENELENNQVPVDLPGLNLNFRPKTPSMSSEASSWNSQAALLRNLSQRGMSQQARAPRRANRRRIFATFGCSGQCLEKGSVSIAETPQKETRRRLDHFAFPVLNNNDPQRIAQVKKPPLLEGFIEAPRKSLEVFGSGRMKNGDIIAKNLARNLSMLTWDAIPKSKIASTTTIGSTTICHDQDMTSDASSDLFEIEDLTGGYGILSNNNMEDDNQEIEGINHHGNEYAPSEASIEWSVVTASAAADFSSVISDYDEKYVGISGEQMIHSRNNNNSSSHRNFKAKNLEGKEAQRGRPGGLLGCKSHKAVNVVESTVVPKSRVVERY
ncbi:OLC1v1012578C1 [Oldenlandia corymbosa var. corymbosa]|uniref:OLC1v1012578C1 n=1 Tax=Oldenlandia corymbosa var. corymbosa TaxID=529605 RepID=A0AAV1DWX0_OLDCO|nr:OLC1v1012578C1 [Oldenlandia corymbosa var. corymbosa]